MAGTYTGDVSDVQNRDTYQKLTTAQLISKKVQYGCFTKTPFAKAVGVEAFGGAAMADAQAFGSAKSNGRMIEYVTGHSFFGGSVFEKVGTNFHTGRMGSMAGELVEGGDEYAYSWHLMNQVQYIPVRDLWDNSGGGRIIDIKAQKMEGMIKRFVEGFNYGILGNANAPDTGVLGPSAVYSDLPNLIAVTEDSRLVGGIACNASTTKDTETIKYWMPQLKEITSPGGGGDMDRPLALRRGLLKVRNDAAALEESSDDYMILTGQGGDQYIDRLSYADTIQGRNGGAMGGLEKYDMAGIQHYALKGAPIIWDPAVTTARGQTASTEVFYGIHIPSYKISIRTEANFHVTDWEEPRVHDQYHSVMAMIQLLYTPAVTQRRPHFLAYNIPACGD